MTTKSPFTLSMIMIMTTSVIMAMSSNNWLMLWLSLELNLLAFIPIMFASSNFQETEACVKYLLIQALGSSILIMASMHLFSPSISMVSIYTLVLLSMMIKTGIAPCHSWYPSVMMSISWWPAFMLSTWQKLAPLMVIMFILTKISTKVLMLVAILNALVGGMLGMNQSFLRAIMAYSSITHMGWMTMLLTLKLSIQSLIYFILYTMLILPIFMMFHLMNSKTLTHMNSSLIKWNFMMYLLPMLMLSLGGLPPLLGFFPKFMVIYSTSQDSIIFLSMLIIGALMNLYFYLNITFSMMLTMTHSNNKSLNLISMNPTLFFMVLATFFIFPMFMMYALTLFY